MLSLTRGKIEKPLLEEVFVCSLSGVTGIPSARGLHQYSAGGYKVGGIQTVGWQ